ncbi:MAG: phage tail protein I, partial [Pseudomonadota bacterium]
EVALADAQAQIHLLREELERLANAAPQSPEPLVATSIPVAARAPDLLAPLTATTAVTDDAAPLTAPEPARLREIRTLLPGNATREERALETVMAEGLIGLEEPLYDLWNVDKCPEDLLPWLAWAFSVETWDHTWPAAFKRNTIRNSLALHRIKGTRRSVELALETLGMRATLREWFELIDSGEDPSARPHTFAVSLRVRDVFAAGYDVDARLRQVMSDLIENVKPVRTRFSLRASSEHHATVSVATRHNGRLRSRRTHCPRIAPHVRSVAFVTQTGWRAKLRDTRHATFEIAEAA